MAATRLLGSEAERHADVTVIVPTYNEAQNVASFLDEAERFLPGARIIFADDDSSDGTRRVATSSERRVEVKVLHRETPRDRGLTASVADALLAVESPYVIVMDADLQHPFATVPEMLGKLKAGADLVVGTRVDDATFTMKRRLASRVARSLAARHLARRAGVRLRDPMSGFFAARADAVRPVVEERGARFERAGYKVLMDLLLHAARPMRIAEVEYVFQARRAGASKLSLRHYLAFLRQLGPVGRLTAGFFGILLTGVLFRFLVVGASGIAINLGALFALHEGARLSIPLAAPAAIELSVLWNFAWNESWTFRGRDTATRIGTRLWKFHVASLVGILLQYAVLAGGSATLPHVHYAWLSIAGIALGSSANFLLNLTWTWGVPIEEE